MVFNSFNLLIFYKAIELLLLFWLLALLFKWVLAFIFGEKGSRIIGFIGYVVNFTLKKFLLKRIFKIEIYECDPFKLSFKHEGTDRWDVLFTSFVLIPMGLGFIIGSFLGAFGLILMDHLTVISIILYVTGFLVAVNSIPTLQDVTEIAKCSIRSIVVWFCIGTCICAILAAFLIPLLRELGVVIVVFVGLPLTSIITFFIPFISVRISNQKNSTMSGGMIDIDG